MKLNKRNILIAILCLSLIIFAVSMASCKTNGENGDTQSSHESSSITETTETSNTSDSSDTSKSTESSETTETTETTEISDTSETTETTETSDTSGTTGTTETTGSIETEGEHLEYETNDDGGYTVIGKGNVTGKDINIPQTYKGKTVTAIGASAFESSDIESISFGINIKSIGERAFAGIAELRINFDGEKIQWLNDVSRGADWSLGCIFYMTYSHPDDPNWDIEI